MEKLVSIIVPVFNSQDTIKDLVNSCINQLSINEFEIIFVDDFSTDDTFVLLQEFQNKYPHVIRVFSNILKGANNARNLGFNLSRGKYIQWLDADDVINPNKLILQINFLENSNNFDIVYSDWTLRTLLNNKIISIEYHIEDNTSDFLKKLLLNKWLPPNAYLLKREVVELVIKNNGWNPNTIVLQDREFFTLAALLGFKFGYLKGNFAIYNRVINKNSTSKKNKITIYHELNKQMFSLIHKINIDNISISIENLDIIKSNILLCSFFCGNSPILNLKWYKIYYRVFPGWKIKILIFIRSFFYE